MATGDRPNFPLTNQRLDKVDIEAISDLIAENTMRTIGSILGPCGGLLSDVVTTYDSLAGTLTIGACRLGYSHYASGSTTAYDGGVVRWDPASAYVAGGDVVDVSAFGTTAGSAGYIFFRRSELAADEDNRAYYDALAQEKKVGVANTRIREIAEFGTELTYDGLSRDDGWFPFLYLHWNVTGNNPDVYKISVFDGFSGGILDSQVVRRTMGNTGLGVPWSQGHIGVVRLFREVIGSLQHVYDNGFTLNADGSLDNLGDLTYRWSGYDLPRGINQLNADLNAAQTSIQSIEDLLTGFTANTITQLNAIQQQQLRTQTVLTCLLPIGTGTLTPTALAYLGPDSARDAITWERSSTGQTDVTFPASMTPGFESGVPIYFNTVAINVTAVTSTDIVCTYEWTSTTSIRIHSKTANTGAYINTPLSITINNVGQALTPYAAP